MSQRQDQHHTKCGPSSEKQKKSYLRVPVIPPLVSLVHSLIFFKSFDYDLIIINPPSPLQTQINPMCERRCFYLWHTAVKRRSRCSFFAKSKSGRSIFPISPWGLSKMTCHSPCSYTLFQERSFKPSLINDLVKGLTLIILKTKSSRQSAGITRQLCYTPLPSTPPKRSGDTVITHKSPQQSLLGYMFYLDANIIKCIK